MSANVISGLRWSLVPPLAAASAVFGSSLRSCSNLSWAAYDVAMTGAVFFPVVIVLALIGFLVGFRFPTARSSVVIVVGAFCCVAPLVAAYILSVPSAAPCGSV
jgi:Ca2+/Na+ antiporter